MAYSTLEDLINIIPERELINLTNDKCPADNINVEKIASSIEYAAELINSYLRNKYKLPLKFIPEIIKNISTDIAAYRLYSRRPEKMPEHIKNGYDEAKKLLISLKKEEMILDLPSEHEDKEVTPSAKMIVTNTDKNSKLFKDEMWNSFHL